MVSKNDSSIIKISKWSVISMLGIPVFAVSQTCHQKIIHESARSVSIASWSGYRWQHR